MYEGYSLSYSRKNTEVEDWITFLAFSLGIDLSINRVRRPKEKIFTIL